MPDWKKIKAEYIRGVSYRKLADEYRVSFSTIQKVGAKEKWTDLRKKSRRKTDEKIVESVSSQESKKAVSINSVADTLLKKIEEGINNGLYVVDAQSTRQIVSALKDLRDIKGIKSELDMKEQIARIEKLNRDVSINDTDNNEYGVFILPSIDKIGKPNGDNDDA